LTHGLGTHGQLGTGGATRAAPTLRGINMLTAEQQQAFDGLYAYAHHQMKSGVTDETIQQAIVEQGWEPEVAMGITANLRAQQQQQPGQLVTPNYYTPASYAPQAQTKSRGNGAGSGDMVLGGIICLIGLVVTIGSYAAASESSGGGRYVIAWGAIVFGAIRFFKGISASGGAS
jgi:hypothetical protein